MDDHGQASPVPDRPWPQRHLFIHATDHRQRRWTESPRGPKRFITVIFLVAAFHITGCDGPLNNPYRQSESHAPIYYSHFSEPPKHLDPAKAYSSDEYLFMAQIYEPPFDYHYLKRPYELIPLAAQTIPQPVYYDRDGNELRGDPPAAIIHRVVYRIRIRKGIRYQKHPCFARSSDGSPYYANITASDVTHVRQLKDLHKTGMRELLAKDYVTQICRLADPRVGCPIYSTMKQYILGLEAYRKAVNDRLDQIRAQRKARVGIAYDQTRDEQNHPIVIDYLSIPFEGVKAIDNHTYIITLGKKYPQMLYWLAMPFFAPIPQEAVDFYSQGALAKRGITLDRYPVGTGPYRFDIYTPNLELILVRNESFHDDFYPSEGSASDKDLGLLADAGHRVPFIERIVFKLEKESLPRWNKFLQGYYDRSGISEDSFDRAIQFSPHGAAMLTEEMQAKGIQLSTSIQTSIFYFGFNMLDPVVGGYTDKQRKLRHAISIAVDNEEWIEIFANGRGIPPHGPIPPGIFGALDGTNKYNPYVYNRNTKTDRLVRKNLAQAKQLLTEAGYPEGRDRSGKPLAISFDTPWESPETQTRLRWLQKKIEAIGLRLNVRATDYSTFRDKVRNANFQLLFWGWNADYPDPENFLFLFYGPNGKKVSGGENACNYDNTRVNQLFKQMESMTNTSRRHQIIQQMVSLIQQDAPWVFVSHPVGFSLSHSWVANRKVNLMTYNTLKFIRIDQNQRDHRRRQWNKPVVWPAALIAVVLVAISVPAVRAVRRDR